MLKRSEDSRKAARLLLDNRKYDGAVAAYYYSVLQRMMYALNEDVKRPLSYEQQNPLNENIHNRILTEIINRFTNNSEGTAFRNIFEKLSDFRKKADYTADSITQDECAMCRSLYEQLIGKLNRFFPVEPKEAE